MSEVQELQEIRSKMVFYGYALKNLDVIAERYQDRFDKMPLAFLARSPFGIVGTMGNKIRLVVSAKHGAANAILVSKIFNRVELENAIFALGETSQKIYVSRWKAIELQAEKEEARTQTYEKHCAYCGKKYIVNVVNPAPTCGKPSCGEKHKKHLELQTKLQAESRERGQASKVEKKGILPDFTLDNPAHTSLQGYVYCVRAENGLCKIGRSADVESRFSELITMSPVGLYLEHTVFSDNYVVAEGYIHEELKTYRHHGEWFDLPSNIFEWVKSLDNYDLDVPVRH